MKPATVEESKQPNDVETETEKEIPIRSKRAKEDKIKREKEAKKKPKEKEDSEEEMPKPGKKAKRHKSKKDEKDVARESKKRADAPKDDAGEKKDEKEPEEEEQPRTLENALSSENRDDEAENTIQDKEKIEGKEDPATDTDDELDKTKSRRRSAKEKATEKINQTAREERIPQYVCDGNDFTTLCDILTGGLEIKDSTLANAGKGLFVTRNFAKGSIICEYGGTVISTAGSQSWRLVQLPGCDGKQANSRGLDGWTFPNSDGKKNPGAMINDARDVTRQNCVWYRTQGKVPHGTMENLGYKSTYRIFALAIKDVTAGDELFLSYGNEWWEKWEADQARVRDASNDEPKKRPRKEKKMDSPKKEEAEPPTKRAKTETKKKWTPEEVDSFRSISWNQ